MSGISGIFNLDGAPIAEADLRATVAMLQRRGPDRTGCWLNGVVGLGHTLLASTPESATEEQPFRHNQTGCVITADVRLDNREELFTSLRIDDQTVGDAELILRAYLEWGDDSPARLLGDFAFAIWDPRSNTMFCARDHSGIRLLYYHHIPGKHFVCASIPRAILVLPQVPYQINLGRVADFLVQELEWIDYTSTFFEGVSRLPPGHKMTVARDRVRMSEYWRPAPVPEAAALSDDEYREGFLEVFTDAVECRLRASQGAVGSMLSGGMDSGSVVAVGKELLGDPLPTYSAVKPRGVDCAESRAAYASAAVHGIDPVFVHPESLSGNFGDYISGLDEPFDGEFTILNAIYRRAQENGQRVVLDGAGGDVVLGEGSYIVRLLRQGRFALAIKEARSEQAFWEIDAFASRMLRYLGIAFTPEFIRRPLRGPRYRRAATKSVHASLISRDLAQAVRIGERYETSRQTNFVDTTREFSAERCDAIRPSVTAGRERYARLAALSGIEPADPFLDKRVIEFCSTIPGHLRQRDGWPKMILRELMADRLPDEVRWGTGKPHLGWEFNDAVTRTAVKQGALTLPELRQQLAEYVDSSALLVAWENFDGKSEPWTLHTAHVLSVWLQENVNRPVVSGRSFG